ncbi:hypothetical protein Agabi119p4_7729 [Agaricus bisporus var. burnettii]|uniref:Uncharacterized protein n=1 Tax=Agaricus bisporus var. burnettii TaxID=192524 RepID=A0A8H7EZB7_AGABI|nr:hypothetical protein Agabi119p4_7729 [Agaricus bisporus var. burnettii]
MVPNLSRSQSRQQFATLRSSYASYVQPRTNRGIQSEVLPKGTLQIVPMRSQVTGDAATSTNGLSSVHSFLILYHHLPLWDFGVEERLSWNTYCFLGITLDISRPLQCSQVWPTTVIAHTPPAHPARRRRRAHASKSSTRSRLSGVIKAAKSSIKSLGSPKPKRKNHITSGLEEHREKEGTMLESAELEIVPTSQESEKELEVLMEERRALRRYDDDSDEEEVVEDSDDENDVAKTDVVPSQTDSNLWNQFSTPPAELMTTLPLPSPIDASPLTYGLPTPSPALLDHPALNARTSPCTHEVLPDLDKTPTTPRVMKITEAEAYVLKVRAANETDSHIMTGVSMSSNQFEENVSKSKEIVGKIVDEEIQSSSPDLPSEPWTFSDDQVAGFWENLNGILNSMARITPRMATNPDAITFELAKFVGRLINSEWAEVKVGHESIASVIREAATYRTPVDIPPPPPAKNVSFAPTPIPTPVNAPTPMEVDASPPRIPAAAKGKKKATPPPPTPQHLDTTSPVFTSPIKISAVPKPLVQPSKTGKQGKPITSYMPYKLSVVTKPTVLNETLAGVTPRPPVQFLLPVGVETLAGVTPR